MKGARIRYSPAELAYISEGRAMPRRVLHQLFVAIFDRPDVTVDHLHSLCCRKRWSSGRRPWTPADDARMRELYPHESTVAVAGALGRTVASTYGRAKLLGLSKTDAYMASPSACRLRRGDDVGRPYRFPKGHVPANKGKRMAFNANSAATRFKPGHVSPNVKWAGHERVDKDGYVWISVNERNPHTGADRRYVAKHRWLWEQAHGPVPNGMVLKCLDGNKHHTDPSNWALIPQALLPRLNGKSGRDYDHAPADVKPTIMAIAKLEQASRRRVRRSTTQDVDA